LAGEGAGAGKFSPSSSSSSRLSNKFLAAGGRGGANLGAGASIETLARAAAGTAAMAARGCGDGASGCGSGFMRGSKSSAIFWRC
jgi:hypothetical protein